MDRLLPVGPDCVCDCVDTRVCDLDGLYACEMACAGVHVARVYRREHYYLDLEHADGGEVLCVLCVWVHSCYCLL